MAAKYSRTTAAGPVLLGAGAGMLVAAGALVAAGVLAGAAGLGSAGTGAAAGDPASDDPAAGDPVAGAWCVAGSADVAGFDAATSASCEVNSCGGQPTSHPARTVRPRTATAAPMMIPSGDHRSCPSPGMAGRGGRRRRFSSCGAFSKGTG